MGEFLAFGTRHPVALVAELDCHQQVNQSVLLLLRGLGEPSAKCVLPGSAAIGAYGLAVTDRIDACRLASSKVHLETYARNSISDR
jgi:hypothetical protein